MKNKKIILIASVATFLLLLIAVAVFASTQKRPTEVAEATPAPTPKPKVNLLDIRERPYVTLQPLQGRNEIQFVVHYLPKQAKSVEVLLEYDRNKGIMDAVLKNFALDMIPYVDKLFLGSKSSGGATTYHDDVIGGTITLTFATGEPYALQVPWRYDDTQPRYTQLATADLKFQMVLSEPFRTPKVIVMQSPGLPAELEGEVVGGPYLVRGVGPLPELTAKLTMRLAEEYGTVKLYGFDGQKWQSFDNILDGRTLTATVPMVEAYVVTK